MALSSWAVFHYVEELDKEHESNLVTNLSDTPNAFISEPVLHASMWDELQDMYPQAIAFTFIRTGTGKNLESTGKFAERVLAISAQCEEGAPLHLKIESWHQNNKADGVEPGYPRMEDIKTVLIPRQHPVVIY
jgi:hypothetical protein